MPVYEGDPEVSIERVAKLAEGAVCNLTKLDFGLHTGTHVDAPLHFIEGAPGVEGIPLDALVGPAWVADATALEGHVDVQALRALNVPADAQRILFKTRNGPLWERDSFAPNYVALDGGASASLATRGAALVGVDYLSVAPFGDPAPVHLVLLRAGVVILEGLDLRAVQPGWHEMVALPLLVPGADGAPTRVLLRAAWTLSR
jgi:arylformamidase